jgi:hypothetical protein
MPICKVDGLDHEGLHQPRFFNSLLGLEKPAPKLGLLPGTLAGLS